MIAVAIFALILAVYYFRSRPVLTHHENMTWYTADYPNAPEAAAMLSRLHKKTVILIEHLKTRYSTTSDSPVGVVAAVDFLSANYKPENIRENDPRFSAETSYTINKGTRMYICLRDRKHPERLMDDDIVFFAHLHELSHITNHLGWGHKDDFWATFAFILREAQIAGVYTPVDYSKYPKDFCGLRVNYNPATNFISS